MHTDSSKWKLEYGHKSVILSLGDGGIDMVNDVCSRSELVLFHTYDDIAGRRSEFIL
jgi:hypothetical protein